METNRKLHEQLFEKFMEKYKPFEEEGKGELTWDGPSNWDLWESQKLKIMFLVKEARQGAHPCVPNQSIEGKFPRNISRWKYAIQKIFLENIKDPHFPTQNELTLNDDIAIVEVKKLNEENISSNNKEIEKYAKEDQELLKQQIEIINPDIIICGNTLNSFDLIYNYTYEIEETLVTIDKVTAWNIDNRFVIDFYHPTSPPAYITSDTVKDSYYFDLLKQVLIDKKAYNFIQSLIK